LTGGPVSGYFLHSALSRDPDPSYAATSPAHRKARPSIFPIKRDTTRDIGSPGLTWLAVLGTLCAWIFGGALVGAIVILAVAVFYGALFVGGEYHGRRRDYGIAQ
jgi:hypothetical protein